MFYVIRPFALGHPICDTTRKRMCALCVLYVFDLQGNVFCVIRRASWMLGWLHPICVIWNM